MFAAVYSGVVCIARSSSSIPPGHQPFHPFVPDENTCVPRPPTPVLNNNSFFPPRQSTATNYSVADFFNTPNSTSLFHTPSLTNGVSFSNANPSNSVTL